jgi:monoamine oxidase
VSERPEASDSLPPAIQQLLASPGMVEIAGGMQCLVERLAHAVKRARPDNKIWLNARVQLIDMSRGKRPQISWTRVGPEKQAFDAVICAVPPKASMSLRWKFGTGDRDAVRDLFAKQYALSNITTDSLAKSLVWYSKRWWEFGPDSGESDLPTIDDPGGPIVGGASYTDLQIQQCWYPSSNAERHGEGMDETFAVRDSGVSDGPGVLTIYMWGYNAERFAALDPAERDEWVISRLEELHGFRHDWDLERETEAAPIRKHRDLIQGTQHFAWDPISNPIGGAVAYFGPGERERYQPDLVAPMRSRGGARVYFAGEHLGVIHGWMQSAVSSAHAAVISALEDLGRAV